MPVSERMSYPVIPISPGMAIHDALRFFRQEPLKQVLVIY
jgi:predicted transcriptional regulator